MITLNACAKMTCSARAWRAADRRQSRAVFSRQHFDRSGWRIQGRRITFLYWRVSGYRCVRRPFGFHTSFITPTPAPALANDIHAFDLGPVAMGVHVPALEACTACVSDYIKADKSRVGLQDDM